MWRLYPHMFSQADVDKRERLLKLFDVQGSASVDIKLIERLLQRCEAVCSHLAQLLEQLFQHFLLVFQQSPVGAIKTQN